eukprot:7145357-Karenia_brevis.AAC.1
MRRRHAQDMMESGSTLKQILLACDWRSAAFMRYLDEHFLETAAVMESNFEASDDEDEDHHNLGEGSASASGDG